MGFTIEQIIELNKTGFTADQIKMFEQGLTITQQAPVQTMPQQAPVQTMPQQAPVQTMPQQAPVQTMPQQAPVQTMAQQAPVQTMPQQAPVQTMPQQAPVQTMPQQAPVEQPVPSFNNDSSAMMLNFIKSLQNANLAQATGNAPKTEDAYNVGLDILGKGGTN